MRIPSLVHRRPIVDPGVWVVTGGASGIGLAVAREAVHRGAQVALFDVDFEAVQLRAKEIGPQAIAILADVTDPESLVAGLARVEEALGEPTVVLANAGIAGTVGTASFGDPEADRLTLEINLHGVWNTLRAAAPQLKRGGHFVVVSSVAAFLPMPGAAAYGVSKAGVEALSRAARIELAPRGITVGVTHFGLVDTPLAAALLSDPLARQVEELLPGPMRRRVDPERLAKVVVDDVLRRAPRTIYPPIYRAVYPLRGVAGPLADAVLLRLPKVRRIATGLDEQDRRRGRVAH